MWKIISRHETLRETEVDGAAQVSINKILIIIYKLFFD